MSATEIVSLAFIIAPFAGAGAALLAFAVHTFAPRAARKD